MSACGLKWVRVFTEVCPFFVFKYAFFLFMCFDVVRNESYVLPDFEMSTYLCSFFVFMCGKHIFLLVEQCGQRWVIGLDCALRDVIKSFWRHVHIEDCRWRIVPFLCENDLGKGGSPAKTYFGFEAEIRLTHLQIMFEAPCLTEHQVCLCALDRRSLYGWFSGVVWWWNWRLEHWIMIISWSHRVLLLFVTDLVNLLSRWVWWWWWWEGGLGMYVVASVFVCVCVWCV